MGQSGNEGNRQARMPRFAFVRHWPDWVSQSGMAGHPIGEKAPIGNTDCLIGYGLYPLARGGLAFEIPRNWIRVELKCAHKNKLPPSYTEAMEFSLLQ